MVALVLDKFLRWLFQHFCLRLRRPRLSRTESWQTAPGLIVSIPRIIRSGQSSFGERYDPLSFKQSFWDRTGVELDRASVEASHDVPHQRIAFRAATACHSADWLFALPISSCALKVDDEAVRVAVGIRLGMVHKSMRVALIL